MGTEAPPLILHGWDGSGFEQLLSRFPNLLVSFSGTLTHSKCPRDLLGFCFDCPWDRMLIGTGAPDYAPAAAVGRDCLPCDVVLVAEKIAAEKRGAATCDSVLQAARANALRAFGM